MNINLVTDAKRHNLALMKISTCHKALGDQIYLNGVGCFDLTIGSWLFDFSEKVPCDIEGGPGIDPTIRLTDYDQMRPDYSLFNLNYSLGYTWAWCPRKCPFCIVPKQDNPKTHHSIWDFHDPKFKKICLLNNNTFSGPQWRETFEEIWDADLTVIDENGYDLRLLDEEKAEALKKTKFKGYIHYAWDLMEDENKIIYGLKMAPRGMVYVLIGFNSNHVENIYRCQIISNLGHDPYVMCYDPRNKQQRAFQRFINTRMYRKYPTIEKAWKDYKCVETLTRPGSSPGA